MRFFSKCLLKGSLECQVCTQTSQLGWKLLECQRKPGMPSLYTDFTTWLEAETQLKEEIGFVVKFQVNISAAYFRERDWDFHEAKERPIRILVSK